MRSVDRRELEDFTRFGHRIDEVTFHPAYHELMAMAISLRIPSIAWTGPVMDFNSSG